MSVASHATDSIAAMHATQMTAFVYDVDALRYLSRVFQESLSIMLLLSPLAGQAILQLCPQRRYVLYGYACTCQSVVALRQTFIAGFMCCTSYMGQALLTDMVALMWVASCAV